MKYYLIALTLMLCLASCSTIHTSDTNTCPPVKPYSNTEQDKVSAELHGCNCPTVLEWLKDYKVSRDQSRACNATNKDNKK